uniref:Ionotropic glutamate receptor C-terminal domain-containing protein n=1 Tax=Photinus pyralis TaxID=7054 RepID=A0A1Y1K8T7_PHOPY
MKVTTFAPCVIFVSFLISSTCNISLKNNPTPWKICVEKVIQTIFGDETLHCVFNESMDLLPSNIRNPRVVININHRIPGNSRTVFNNYIFEVNNFDSLKRCVWFLNGISIGGMFELYKIRLLVITDHVRHVLMIFEFLWRYGFTYLAILVIDKDEDAKSFLFTGNPQDVENYCGIIPNTIQAQNCDQAIEDTIPHPIRDHHECSIEFHTSHLTYFTQHLDKLHRKNFTIVVAVEMLNVSLNTPKKKHVLITVDDGVLISAIGKGNRMSHVYIRDVMVWVVPPTDAISALEILAVNFDVEVWILVSVIFAIFTMAWYVLDKFKTSLGEIVLKTFGITLFGSTSRITQSSKLRFVILCYIIYSVHIQTAYVSNLMRLMSSPPRRQPIRNLKELLEADIPMCMDSSATYVSNSHMVPEIRKIYDKIVVRSCPIRSHDPRVLLERWSARPNFSIAIPLKTLHALALDLRLRIPNYFIDKHILPPLMQTFAYGRSGSIIDSLNIIIDRLIDSGLYDKLDRDRSSYDDSKRRELPQDEEVVALSLEHLNGIFIVFCFGMVLSIMAFIGERIAHRFSMSH